MKALAIIAILIATGYAYTTIKAGQGTVVSARADEQGPQCNKDLYDKAIAGNQAALIELRLNAEKGDPSAQNNLALMYLRGEGVPRDYAEAMKWYRKAADQGLDVAQDALGVMYGNGEGVAHDYSEARKWFLLAADQGNESAKKHLLVAVPAR